jgi:hypothetical protein
MKKRSLGLLLFLVGFGLAVKAQNPPPTVQFSAANYTAIEGTGMAAPARALNISTRAQV